MSIGSIANTAFAHGAIKHSDIDMTSRERLLLLLIADACSAGLGWIELEYFARYTAAPDAVAVHEDLKSLARHGLISVSDIHDGDVAIALEIAEPDEIASAREHLECDFPFIITTEKHGSTGT